VEATFIKKPPFTTVVKPVYIVKLEIATIIEHTFTEYGTFTTVVKVIVMVKFRGCQNVARVLFGHASLHLTLFYRQVEDCSA
jgi:hypothetical protein